MRYLEFRKGVLAFQVFSTRDIEKLFPDFDSRRLVEWQEKGYLRKLVNKWYMLAECKEDEQLLYRISNCIYRPSYISLVSALAFYHLIPEGVYSTTAITTKKTKKYVNPLGTFDFQSLKPTLFFGYTILHRGKLPPVLMADMEKAILDYLYLQNSLQSAEDIEHLRFNFTELRSTCDWQKMSSYQLEFKSRVVDKRVKYLKAQCEYADTL